MPEADSKSLMAPAQMKPLLMLSKREPVSCAIGLTKDKEGALLLVKKVKPRKVLSLAKKAASTNKLDLDMVTMRFGKASVDTDVDSSLVTFTVNKDVSGALRPKILVLLKKAGFGKCEIVVDTTLENEPEDDEHTDTDQAAAAHGGANGSAEAQNNPGDATGAVLDDTEASAGGSEEQNDGDATLRALPGRMASADQNNAGDATGAVLDDTAASAGGSSDQNEGDATGAVLPTEMAGADQTMANQNGADQDNDGDATGAVLDKAGPAPDAGAVTTRLTGLVKKMMGVMASNPPGADAMKTAALGAQASLKSGDMAGAMQQADTLERMLGSMAPNAPAGPAGTDSKVASSTHGSPVFEKARAAWSATRRKVDGELDKLHAEVTAMYKGHPMAADLGKAFAAKVDPIMDKLDDSLSKKLDEVSANKDAGSHAKLVQEAKAIIKKYEDYVGSEEIIAALDKNPFVPLQIQSTLTATLGALSDAVA